MARTDEYTTVVEGPTAPPVPYALIIGVVAAVLVAVGLAMAARR